MDRAQPMTQTRCMIMCAALRHFRRKLPANWYWYEQPLPGKKSMLMIVVIDPEAMAIVISNLLENAVKYGDVPAAVEIDLSMDGNRAVLEVADNGAGIPKDDVELIFGRFYRGGDEMTRTARGTGLGLYLVQQIVEAHRGKVGVASTGPTGTIFRVTVPGFEV